MGVAASLIPFGLNIWLQKERSIEHSNIYHSPPLPCSRRRSAARMPMAKSGRLCYRSLFNTASAADPDSQSPARPPMD
jgi:hypothetical protein